MKWFSEDEEGRMRLCGFPISSLWLGDANAILDGFEPENPKLLVARKYGLGWDLNLGAIAAKAGWIRPDDSLPDLATHVPPALSNAMRVAPVVGGAATAAMALLLSRKDSVAISWTPGGSPRKFASGKSAALGPVLLVTAVAALPRLVQREDAESQQAVRLGERADLLGAQAVALVGMAVSYRTALHPNKRQFFSLLAPLLWPAVAGGLQLACVKTALRRVNAGLRETMNAEEEMSR